MKYLLLVLIISVAISLEDVTFIQFRDIDSDGFGKTLIDTLELHIQSGQSLDNFVDTMRNLETQFEQELKDDTQNNNNFQKLCDQDLVNLENEQNSISLTLVEQQGKLDELVNEKQRKQQIVQAKKDWLAQVTDQLDKLSTLRKQEAESYDQNMNENSYVIVIINQIKKNFVKSDGISMIEIDQDSSLEIAKNIHEDIENAVDESKNFRQNSGYRYMFQIFAEITARVKAKGDSEAITRLKDLCQQLLVNVEDNMSLLRRSEDKRQNIFNKQKESLDKDIQQLTADLAQNDAALQGLATKIEYLTNDMNDYKQRLIQKKQTQDDRKTECQQSAYSYKQTREDNERKRQLVSQVIGLFSANQREFKDYIRQRQ
ncbi:hypothetical protein pb186bvf_004288 [Paramecium bursaria]